MSHIFVLNQRTESSIVSHNYKSWTTAFEREMSQPSLLADNNVYILF